MQHVQAVQLEPPGGCNYTDRHPECPARLLGRDRPAAMPRSPDFAVHTALELVGLGFRGFFNFHWYSEPMLSRPWIQAVMDGIRKGWPRARFGLWTNGSLLAPGTCVDCLDFAANFMRIFISNYDARDWSWLRNGCRAGCFLQVWDNPVLDTDRLALPDPLRFQRSACIRPYTDFVVTREGDVPLCCQAWRPSQRVGNVLEDGVQECVRRFLAYREDAVDVTRALPAGHPCLGCAHPERDTLHWDEEIAREARRRIACQPR